MAIRTTTTWQYSGPAQNRIGFARQGLLGRVFAGLLCCFFAALAQGVTLEWDRNSEPAVIGYRAYCGTATRSYSAVQDVGGSTTATMNTLTPGLTYYFAVTAYTADGLESDFSDEVSYTVPIPNFLPVAISDSYTTLKATVLTVSAANGVLKNDTDGDTDPLTAVLVSNPANGTLTLSANGAFTYTPASAFIGTDSFSYRASDGKATSSVVIVTIAVTAAPNNLPLASADSYTTLKATALSVAAGGGVLVNDTDADGDPLTASLVSNPANGTVNLSANGGFTYTPNSTFIGTDSFSYRVSDGKGTSSAAVATITVTAPPNSAPVATGDSYTTTKATALAVNASNGVLKNDTDVDGDTLTVLLVNATANGTLNISPNGGFTYAPSSTFIGTDSFSYRAQDGKTSSSVTVVTISVTAPPNSVPLANSDSYSTQKGVALSVSSANGVLMNDTDADGDLLSALLVSNPAKGTLILNPNGAFTYTPTTAADADSFSYRVADGKATSSVSVVTINILAPTNRPPLATADSYSTSKKSPLSITAAAGVLANDADPDGDALVAVLQGSPANGSVTLNADGSLNYTPNPSFTGMDAFSYFVSDGKAASPVVTVSVTVRDVTGPVAKSDNYKGGKRSPLHVSASAGILANDVGPDGATLTVVLVSSTTQGELTLAADGGFTYLPGTNSAGSDTFSYYVSDGNTMSAVTTVVIILEDAPPLPCVDCFAELDAFLLARSAEFSKVLDSRAATPTNGPCLDAALWTIGAVAKAARKSTDTEFVAAMNSAAACLITSVQARLDEQKQAQRLMLVSKWSAAASSQIAKVETLLNSANGASDVATRARLLASLGKLVSRTDTYISAGTVAPEDLSYRTLQFNLTIGREKITQVLQLDSTGFVARDLAGRLMATGTYTYSRGTWNQGTLVLTYAGVPRTETVAITFTSKRWKLQGQQMRGYAVTQ